MRDRGRDGGKMVGSEKEKKEGRMEEKKGGRDRGRKERSHNDLCLWVKPL